MISSLRTFALSLHHLFFATIALSCGIAMQAYYKPLPTLSPSILTIFSLIVIFGSCIPQGRTVLWLLLPGAFLCGALRYQAQQDNHNFLYARYKGYHDKLIGIVMEKEKIEHPYLRQRITLSLDKDPKVLLSIFTPQKIDAIPGDTLEFNQVFLQKNANLDYDKYLTKEGIIFSLFLKNTQSYKVLALGKNSWSQRLSVQRNRIVSSLRKKLSKKTFTLFSALFLGYKQTSKEDLAEYKNLFKNWGLLHYLARAGLHVVIIIWLLQIFTRIIPCAFTLKQIFMTLFIILYWLLSWPSTSFIRALTTFFLFSWCVIARWQSTFLHILTISCFFTLLLNPIQLFFLDFQLSYGITYALAFMTLSRPTKS